MKGAAAFRWAFGVAAVAGTGLLAGSAARSRFGGIEVAGRVDAARLPAMATGIPVGPERGVPILRVFGDYECPACRALEQEAGDTLRALARRGLIRFVYHHAPLRGHRRGPDAAAAAYCAADAGATRSVHRALYESAPHWGNGPDGEDRLLAVVAAAAADTAGLRECMRSERTAKRVAADRAAADALGIAAVPMVLLGDQLLEVGSWRALVRFVTARALSP